MAFCRNCGAPLAEGSAFCESCGAPVGAAAPVTRSANDYIASYEDRKAADAKNARMASFEEMTRMINYFGQKSSQYDEYDRLNDDLDYLAGYRRPGLLVWGIIIAVVGLITFIAGVESSAGAAIAGIIILLVGGLLIFLYANKKANVKKRIEQETDRICQLADELTEHYKNYGYCSVGMEYTNPKILQQMGNLIRQGRADTPKEAINIMIEDAHRTDMEMMQMETMRAARAASRGSAVAAGFAAANFFLR